MQRQAFTARFHSVEPGTGYRGESPNGIAVLHDVRDTTGTVVCAELRMPIGKTFAAAKLEPGATVAFMATLLHGHPVRATQFINQHL